MSTNRVTLEQEMVSRHIRFAKPLDDWLSDYALKNGYSSPAELVREIARNFKESKTAQARQEAA